MLRYKVIVVGGIWWPYGAKASMEYQFEMGWAETHEDVTNTVTAQAGDFSSIDDFELYVWGELCPHCHNQGWLLVKEFTPEGKETYIDTFDELE